MKADNPKNLDSDKVIKTINELHTRILERFPNASLAMVCKDLLEIARLSKARIAWIEARDYKLYTILFFSIFIIVGLIYYLIFSNLPESFNANLQSVQDMNDVVGLLGSASEALTLIGLIVFFVITFEKRIKKNRALKALHELRSIAHIIDMHQLTKDPNRLRKNIIGTKSSPKLDMNINDLIRYLDYCTEMLSLTGKIAALYGTCLEDGESISTVNDIEDLTTGLSRKIWQKLMILSDLYS
ncbi:MAG TPA: hypothetical protein ENK82_03605 [Campylobacterales bacterium]|nr:hypothetical protein [Campylobacterales bacterium]HHS92407.1 hypothetical protein [Campylobacterales bacterium]